MPSTWSTQCILQYISEIPRDVSMTTWAFRSEATDPTVTQFNELRDAVASVFNGQEGANNPLSTYISGVVSRNSQSARFKAYRQSGGGASGPPEYESGWTLGGLGSGSPTAMPLECAIVMSFQGDPITGGVQARRRGRVYLGPWTSTALGSTSNDATISQSMIDRVAASGARLLNWSDSSSNWTWCVWSRTTGLFVPVTNGWINNEWDTQRRREKEATARTLWPA